MAEALGLAASIASLLQIAAQITQLSYSYISDVRNAPKAQKLYLQELSAFNEVLFRAEQAIQEAEVADLSLSRPEALSDDVLGSIHESLATLQIDLQKRVRRLLWPFQEKELKKYIEYLHRFRGVFADFLTANIMLVFLEDFSKRCRSNFLIPFNTNKAGKDDHKCNV
jgi:hypothetical protein